MCIHRVDGVDTSVVDGLFHVCEEWYSSLIGVVSIASRAVLTGDWCLVEEGIDCSTAW